MSRIHRATPYENAFNEVTGWSRSLLTLIEQVDGDSHGERMNETERCAVADQARRLAHRLETYARVLTLGTPDEAPR